MSVIGTSAPRRRRIARFATAVTLIALSTAALPDRGTGHEAMVEVAATGATVTIDHHAFAPAALTIAVGTTVIWKNADDTPHTVTEKNRAFRSEGLDTGDSFTHTFTTPGDYTYFCSLHPFMVGEIVVKPAGKSKMVIPGADPRTAGPDRPFRGEAARNP
jgi:plastocyanin